MSETGKKTILLVEDEAVIALAESDALRRHGFGVVVAGAGKEAVERVLADESIDLILMDLDLGRGMDGTEAARLILEQRDLPIIFLSNHTEADIVEKIEKITSYGYVVKNTGETVLLASIKMAFRLHSAHRREKEKERALLQERENLQSILAASPVGMLVIDEDQVVGFANEAAAALFGGKAGESWTGRCGDFFICENRASDPRGCGFSECCKVCPISRAVERCLAAGQEPLEAGGETSLRISSSKKRMWVKYKVRNLRLDGRNRVLLAIDDITDRATEKQALEKLILISERFLRSEIPDVDYKFITDSLMEISGARYAVFNRYNAEGTFLTSMAMSGEAENIGKAGKILGFEIVGKTWPYDPVLAAKLDGNVITRFPTLSDVIGDVIPRPAVQLVTKLFGIGETVVIKVMLNKRILGDFKLIMPRGESCRNEGILEVYARQVGLLLMRKQAEHSLAAAAAENATLLRELQHRVKNSLSLICSLIHLETGRTENADVRAALTDIENRVMVLSNLYGLLNEGGTMEIRLDLFLSRICESLEAAFSVGASSGKTVGIEARFDEAVMEPRRASSVGLILNELATNAFKYAFRNGNGGKISVTLGVRNRIIELAVADDGEGLPKGFDPDRSPGFGFKLVGMLAAQLGGSFSWEGRRGTTVRVRIPQE